MRYLDNFRPELAPVTGVRGTCRDRGRRTSLANGFGLQMESMKLLGECERRSVGQRMTEERWDPPIFHGRWIPVTANNVRNPLVELIPRGRASCCDCTLGIFRNLERITVDAAGESPRQADNSHDQYHCYALVKLIGDPGNAPIQIPCTASSDDATSSNRQVQLVERPGCVMHR
jgi:hypothetical protein